MVEYDVIIIGAGSVGVPTALTTANDGLKTLVLDFLPSVAQADNKHAIGGIRATHSNIGKALLCKRSIEIFSGWEKKYGDDIWWHQGGYTFLAFTEEDEKMLKDTVKLQKSFGLNIGFLESEKVKELIPGINDEGLLGGSYSPEDGNASPLLSLHSFFRRSKNLGAEYRFNENVVDIIIKKNRVIGIKTDKAKYKTNVVINAAGAQAKGVGNFIGLNLPIEPESHEAGITEPVKRLFSPMVVDIRPGIDEKFGNSKNYYFYQNSEGKILFCLTPNPNITGIDRRETSSFLPQITKRMIQLLPRLKNIKIRRTWRGLYPMTHDGNPIVGKVEEVEGYINAVGMCGQGFMLGPGLGETISRIITEKTTPADDLILNNLTPKDGFFNEEVLK
ncbi:MAG: FAD-binding oxidoreductase [Candidatus Lokiarchaeota archaeon]|nr:FAD-binding oxidoreductase [Candidatus Lokiarchaeota archaeon]